MTHECKLEFETEKIDNCTGKGWDVCHGTKPMTLELYNQETNGLEDWCDQWVVREVKYCPYCGLKAEEDI